MLQKLSGCKAKHLGVPVSPGSAMSPFQDYSNPLVPLWGGVCTRRRLEQEGQGKMGTMQEFIFATIIFHGEKGQPGIGNLTSGVHGPLPSQELAA